MPAGKFDEQLKVNTDNSVAAGGPLDKTVAKVIELCVWVTQRQEDTTTSDAVANAMAPDEAVAMEKAAKGEEMDMSGPLVKLLQPLTDAARWTLLLKDLETDTLFRDGSATAIAIGVFEIAGGKRTAFVWSEPVWLKVAATT
jgi:hypothetical protein